MQEFDSKASARRKFQEGAKAKRKHHGPRKHHTNTLPTASTGSDQKSEVASPSKEKSKKHQPIKRLAPKRSLGSNRDRYEKPEENDELNEKYHLKRKTRMLFDSSLDDAQVLSQEAANWQKEIDDSRENFDADIDNSDDPFIFPYASLAVALSKSKITDRLLVEETDAELLAAINECFPDTETANVSNTLLLDSNSRTANEGISGSSEKQPETASSVDEFFVDLLSDKKSGGHSNTYLENPILQQSQQSQQQQPSQLAQQEKEKQAKEMEKGEDLESWLDSVI